MGGERDFAADIGALVEGLRAFKLFFRLWSHRRSLRVRHERLYSSVHIRLLSANCFIILVTAAGEVPIFRASAVVDAMREAGVLVGVTGPRDDVLKIRPPLVFGAEHVHRAPVFQ